MEPSLGRMMRAEPTTPLEATRLSGRVVVLACAPSLLVTVERDPADESGVHEIHLHPGGQGFWVARMAALLGAEATIVAPLAGESGVALHALMEDAGVHVASVPAEGSNAVLVSSGREGDDASMVQSDPSPLSRHDIDALISAFFAAALECDIAVLTGYGEIPLMDETRFSHIAHDIRALGRRVMADLSGASLHAALEGGLDIVKVSDEEIVASGLAKSTDRGDLMAGITELHSQGASLALVSRAEQPLLVSDGDDLFEVVSPAFRPVNHRGAGDSLTGATAAGLASGMGLRDALRVAVAAGALNVTRHGLGTGDAQVIEALAREVEIRPVVR
jgi:1-phosphofructokinase